MNIVSQIYLLAVKELSELSHGCEWPQLWPLTAKARDTLNNPSARLNFLCVELQSTDLFRPSLEPSSCQTVSGDRRPWTWVYSEQANYEGLVRNELASFWTPRASA